MSDWFMGMHDAMDAHYVVALQKETYSLDSLQVFFAVISDTNPPPKPKNRSDMVSIIADNLKFGKPRESWCKVIKLHFYKWWHKHHNKTPIDNLSEDLQIMAYYVKSHPYSSVTYDKGDEITEEPVLVNYYKNLKNTCCIQ